MPGLNGRGGGSSASGDSTRLIVHFTPHLQNTVPIPRSSMMCPLWQVFAQCSQMASPRKSLHVWQTHTGCDCSVRRVSTNVQCGLDAAAERHLQPPPQSQNAATNPARERRWPAWQTRAQTSQQPVFAVRPHVSQWNHSCSQKHFPVSSRVQTDSSGGGSERQAHESAPRAPQSQKQLGLVPMAMTSCPRWQKDAHAAQQPREPAKLHVRQRNHGCSM